MNWTVPQNITSSKMSQVAYQAGVYPSFYSMKRLAIFLLPPGWDASPSQDYASIKFASTHLNTPGLREALRESSALPKNTTQCPQSGLEPRALDPETSTLTMRPLHLPLLIIYNWS